MEATKASILTWATLLISASATASPLEARLITATAPCRAMFNDPTSDEEAEKPSEVKDIANGYLHIEGSYPTCGCRCAATAAAFQTASGDYRILSYEAWSCSGATSLSGDDWATTLPEGLRAELAPDLAGWKGEAVFYLEAKLPRRGTTVDLKVRLLPLGVHLTCPFGICSVASEALAKFDELDDTAAAAQAKSRYDAYQRLALKGVVLEWNRAAGRFVILERRPAEKPLALKAFEAQCGRWSPGC